jgi:tetratricopeptide (TPR) repeat protein
MGEQADGYEYAAFISYRHAEVDRRWAKWAHRTLETYRVPAALVKQRGAPARVGRCFRDEEELPASADLSAEIDRALVASRFLIVVCSPRTPQSRWVNREVERFRELGRGDRIVTLLTEGEPAASFPRALTEIRRVAGDGAERIDEVEPLAADVRPGRHESRGHLARMARLRMVACVLGVRFDDLRNREQQRRNRRLAALASVAAALLLAMSLLTAFAFHQRGLAVQRTAELTREKAEVERQKRRVEEERDTVRAVFGFLVDDVLSGARPERVGDAKALDAIDRAMLRPAAAAVGARFATRPNAEASVRHALAIAYNAMGRFELALPQARRAFDLRLATEGADDQATLASQSNLALVLGSMGRNDEAAPLYRDLVARAARTLGPDHEATLTGVCNYAELLWAQGHPELAEPLLKDALARSVRTVGADHPDAITSLANYAGVLQALGREAEAEPMEKEALDRRTRVQGADDPATLAALQNYATGIYKRGRPAEAAKLFADVLERETRVLGADHPTTIMALNNYATALKDSGRADEAEPIFKDALARKVRTLGPDHASAITALNNYANVLFELGRAAEAEPLFKEGAERSVRTLGADHPDAIQSTFNHAMCLAVLRRFADAEPLLKDALERAATSPTLGPGHKTTLGYARNYAHLFQVTGRPDQAAAVRAKYKVEE